eukprot:TRINITY_DN6023_c0_g1_i1.p1 TRINITY_DN6023_c0_g1~~TRINITY_DN6023_c0_g1_i1.p1  ORF type:complete len:326 (+),score=60.87 TRINITY_DN6023_c0_g1_i1:44-979(+)
MKLFKGPVPKMPWRKSASVVIAAPIASTTAPATCEGLKVQSKCDYRICMLKRHGKSSFMGNAVVFPGGAMDPEDIELAKEYFTEEMKGKVCAAREAFEEAGATLFNKKITVGEEWRKRVHGDGAEYKKLLQEYNVRPGVEKLHYWCQFTTPDVEAARVKKGGFETEFYVTVIDGTETAHLSCDRKETTELTWFSPEECLEAHRHGLIYLPPPQWTIMTELADHVTSLSSIRSYAKSAGRSLIRDHPIKPYLLVPSPEGILTMAYPGDELHPIYPTKGGRSRIAISKEKGIVMDRNVPLDTRIEKVTAGAKL